MGDKRAAGAMATAEVPGPGRAPEDVLHALWSGLRVGSCSCGGVSHISSVELGRGPGAGRVAESTR